jgi:hypothetical protein
LVRSQAAKRGISCQLDLEFRDASAFWAATAIGSLSAPIGGE